MYIPCPRAVSVCAVGGQRASVAHYTVRDTEQTKQYVRLRGLNYYKTLSLLRFRWFCVRVRACLMAEDRGLTRSRFVIVFLPTPGRAFFPFRPALCRIR